MLAQALVCTLSFLLGLPFRPCYVHVCGRGHAGVRAPDGEAVLHLLRLMAPKAAGAMELLGECIKE